MEGHGLLIDIVILLAVSIPVSYAFHRLKLSSIVGFLVTGIIVGPHGAGWISEIEAVKVMAEIGVVLLLFTIGLEFSFKQLLSGGMRLLWISLAQVAGTALVTVGASVLAGLPVRQGIFLGFLFTLSSTAIVLKILSERNEIDTPQGRIAVGVLIFQDLCVIPMMLLIPSLAGESVRFVEVLKQVALAIVTIGILVLASLYIIPRVLREVVQLKNREVFLITVLFVCLGTAYATSAMGLSLAIGAFIAGLVISESNYSHQILADILPFRDIFNAMFFISVGMLLNVRLFWETWRTDLLIMLLVFIGKAFLILVILLAAKNTFRISWIAAFSLAQVGEFSFLLGQQGEEYKVLPESLNQLFLASSILTMILAPFAILLSGPAGMKLQQFLGRRVELPEKRETKTLRDHLVIVGFGLNGQNLARVVRDIGIPFQVIELNDKLVKEAQKQNLPVVFGDATRKEVLHQAGVEHARMVVIAISDPSATRSAVASIRSVSHKTVILVRTRYVIEVDSLMNLGANLVIPEEFETSIEIFSRVLEQYNIPDHLIDQQVTVIRSGSYGMLRGLSLSQERLMKLSELFLKSTVQQIVIRPESPAKDQTLQQLDLRKATGASIIAVIRGEKALNNPGADFRLEANDIVVLWGAHAQLAEAVKILDIPKADSLSQTGEAQN
jgi:CPA2 family monovalent cation:H+ antiporter-2